MGVTRHLRNNNGFDLIRFVYFLLICLHVVPLCNRLIVLHILL